ncbi:hypothetical protein niasHS_007038 [Heterodera schachtii]|uniref:Uncharacterized protein n=1 Tax=Heterodera schachtii TaxID=97005 RepID=A0ABD2JFA7_HETSC
MKIYGLFHWLHHTMLKTIKKVNVVKILNTHGRSKRSVARTACYKLFKSCFQECYMNQSQNDVYVLNCRIDLGICVNQNCSLTVCPRPKNFGRCHEKCRSKTRKMQNDPREWERRAEEK